MSKLDDHFARTYKVTSYLLNGKITEQNTLWDGFLYMQGGQEVKLSTPIDQTKSGIVLVFSFVENEKAQDYAWHSFLCQKLLSKADREMGINLTFSGILGAKNICTSITIKLLDSRLILTPKIKDLG